MLAKNELLRARGISVNIGGETLIDGIDITVYENELLSIVGLNYSGKTLLGKAICGLLPSNYTSAEFSGRNIDLAELKYSNEAMYLSEDSEMINSISVAENLFAVDPQKPFFSYFSYKKIYRRTQEFFSKYGVDIDPGSLPHRISRCNQHLAMICKAGLLQCRLLVLDEINNSYTPKETDQLLSLIRQFPDITVIYLSNNIDPILLNSDRVIAMRNRTFARIFHIGEVSPESLRRTIAGHITAVPKSFSESMGLKTTVFSAEYNLGGHPIVITGNQGEIVGIHDPDGDRIRSLLNQLTYGSYGNVTINNKRVNNYKQAVASGLGIIPQEFINKGLFPRMSLNDNLSLQVLKRASKIGVINQSLLDFAVDQYKDELEGHLLPGQDYWNYFLMYLYKWRINEVRILILDNPTAHLDIVAKNELFKILSSFTRDGIAVMLLMNDHRDYMAYCDRIILLQSGK